MKIPHDQLEPATLRNIIEEFVLREGTEYGAVDVSVDTKVSQVMKQLSRGDVCIVFDSECETTDIVSTTSSRYRKMVGNG